MFFPIMWENVLFLSCIGARDVAIKDTMWENVLYSSSHTGLAKINTKSQVQPHFSKFELSLTSF